MKAATTAALLAAILAAPEARSQDAKPAPRPAPTAAAKPSPEGREAEIYRAAKSAMTEARNRAARADVSTRKSALARETESRLRAVASKYSLPRDQLDRIISEGQAADGTAAKKSKAQAKAQAKARNQEQLGAIGAPPAPNPLEGASPQQFRSLMEAAGQVPAKKKGQGAPR